MDLAMRFMKVQVTKPFGILFTDAYIFKCGSLWGGGGGYPASNHQLRVALCYIIHNTVLVTMFCFRNCL